MSAVTAFQQAAVALANALLVSPALAGGNVKANPTRPFAREVSAGIAVRLESAQRDTGTNCGEVWVCRFAFDVEARGISGADPADAVDALLSAVAARVEAADLSAAGVVGVVADGSVEWDFEPADTPVARATLRQSFEIHVVSGLVPATP